MLIINPEEILLLADSINLRLPPSRIDLSTGIFKRAEIWSLY